MSHLRSVLLCCLTLLIATPLLAQDSTTTAATPPAAMPAENPTLTQIAEQALNTERLIAQMDQLAVHPTSFAELQDLLPQVREQVKNLKGNTDTLQQDSKAGVEQIRTVQSQWQFLHEQLDQQQQAIRQRAADLESGLVQLTQEEERWKQLKAQGNNAIAALPDAQKQQQRALNDLASARKRLTSPLQETLALTKQWQELLDSADDNVLTLKQHEQQLRKLLLSSLQTPLWQLQAEDFRINDGTRQAVLQQIKLTLHYILQYPGRALATISATLLMLLFLWRVRVRRGSLRDSQSMPHLNLPLIDRPMSTTVATSVALALSIYPAPPQLLHSSLSLLLFIPVVRLGLSRLPALVHPLAWLISLFFAINNLSVLTEAIPALQRLWVVCCAAISAGVCVHALHRLAISEDRNSLFWRTLRGALWLALVSAVTAMLGGLAGAATLAQFLITGVANSAYAGLCMVVVAGILSDLAVTALYLPATNGSELLNRNRALLVGRSGKLASLVCALAWINFTLDQFLLRDPLWQWLRNALQEKLVIGNLSVSSGDVLAVVITLWISIKLSQFLRFIFIEDIAPRTRMNRGVPEAIATLMHYGIILIGFMFAISAAGIDLSKLAIMAGALGVGIGIGLQDVVNNFTSGLILLFEQNIKQGDIIQCSTVNGRVIQIGLRSSVVRTFDGAEVIVPNSQLVSAQVINWTHSDQQRRITLPVGAAYGSDAQKVIEILVNIAREDKDILCDPEPNAFLLRLGPSSMDFELRAWVASGEILNDVTSRLCVAITRRFEQEGIEIPFPQQDVHVRSLPEQCQLRPEKE